MNCPICNFSELSEGAASCPACQSDLEVFAHLEDAHKQHLFQKRLIAVLAVLLVIVAVVSWGATRFFYVAENKHLQADTTANNATVYWLIKRNETLKENEKLNAELISFKAEVKSLNEMLGANKSSPTSQEAITHIVKEGESLCNIAEKYYQDGLQYKKIADDNGLTDPKSIRAGMKLTINK